MRFPPEFLDRLRTHLPISEVVGKRIPLKRHGREYQALCPFHKEKSPSFTVSDEKGFYHCFGCGAHGDAIGFLIQFEGLSYLDAIERLAIEAGLPLPQITRQSQELEHKRHSLEEVTALAAHWFAEQLKAPGGREAREYLQGRGVKQESIDRFELGFAPSGRDYLKAAFGKQGISEALLIEAGLLGQGENGSSYDRFRGRLMFPIRNTQGKTIAFGGRVLPSVTGMNAAKYLNSPETPLFKKGEMLFAYDTACKASRESGRGFIVVEGYMDVVALHQSGFVTAVAPLGTAVTEAQLRLLWRNEAEPILCLDGDAAGERAMLRTAELALPLLKAGQGLQFAFLPSGEDPDSLLRQSGIEPMHRVINQAKPLSQALWEQAFAYYNGGQTAEKKAALEQYLMQSADRIADPIMKQQIRQYFRDEIYKINRWKPKGKVKNVMQVTLPSLPAIHDETSHIKRLENQLVVIILLRPDILHKAQGIHGQSSDIEEDFGRIELIQPALDKLRGDILEISRRAELEESARMREELAERGHDEIVNMLLHDIARNQPAKTLREWETNPKAASAAWHLTREAYGDKLIDREIASLSLQTTESAHYQIIEMKKQREDRHRVRYTIASDEQFS